MGEYSLWTTPTEAVSRDFERQFEHAAIALGKKAYFTPHMYIYDGIKSNCQGADGENVCYNLCTNNGRYCATDPDSDLDNGISGADVVTESLRRICIWKIYGEDDGIGKQWWEYVNEFMYRCASEGFFTDSQCINDAYLHANIEAKKVKSCMETSGGLEKDVENTLLEDELIAKDVAGVVILPTMSRSAHLYRRTILCFHRQSQQLRFDRNVCNLHASSLRIFHVCWSNSIQKVTKRSTKPSQGNYCRIYAT